MLLPEYSIHTHRENWNGGPATAPEPEAQATKSSAVHCSPQGSSPGKATGHGPQLCYMSSPGLSSSFSWRPHACSCTEKFSCLLPPSASFMGRSGLYQGEFNYLNSGQVGRPQAREGADVLVCFLQHCQAATLMLPRNIQTFGLSHLITTSSKVSRTSHTWVSASCGLSE